MTTGFAATANATTRLIHGGNSEKKALKALENYVERHRTDWGLPGMTVTVVTREGFEGFVTSGLADVEQNTPVGADHLFQVGSISKMFGALTVYSLIEEGVLTTETKIEESLRGLRIRDGEGITLQHLLNHTAGLPADSSIFPEGGLWSAFEPGTNWSYSNSGYYLAGLIAASAAGAPYPDVVFERVLSKIGMSASKPSIQVVDRDLYAQGYEPALTDRLNPHPGIMTAAPWVDLDNAAGCIASTGGDMAKFLRFLINLNDGKGSPVFNDATAARFLADPVEGWSAGAHYGNGIARVLIDGREYLHHTGGMVSFCSSLHVDRKAGVAAFASTNVHYALNYRPRLVTLYACELMRALSNSEPAPKPKSPVEKLEKSERFVGVFMAEDGDRIEVISDNAIIRLRHDDVLTAMQQVAPNLFTAPETKFAITGIAFEFDGEDVARLWAGDVEYLRDQSLGYKPQTAPALKAYAGRYDNDDRWAGPIYVYARNNELWIGNAVKLTLIDDNLWRLGDDSSPERITFGGFINGAPHQLIFSGTPYLRRFS
ncbi:MAG: serine hydrolase domain-containing protein [Parvularculaceae bacterium]